MGSGYLPVKMKRKDLEEVNDDFSDFSLSSPARKIRRLDVELPPIMEEEEAEAPFVFKPEMHFQSNMEQVGGVYAGPVIEEGGYTGPVIEEVPAIVPDNEERAIVLFKPINTPLLKSPSNFSVSVNSDIIMGFKNQILWSSQANALKSTEDEAARQYSNTRGPNECLAVVPWVPSQISPTPGTEVPQTETSKLMESEDMESTTMDIEENNVVVEPGQGCGFSGMNDHQWRQQQQQQQQQQPPHCMQSKDSYCKFFVRTFSA